MDPVRWKFVIIVTAIAAVLLVLRLTAVDVRLVSAVVGAAAAGGLAYRMISTAYDATILLLGLSAVLVAILVLGALGQWELAQRGNVAVTKATVPILFTRVGCLIVAIMWTDWMHRKPRLLHRT